MQKQSYLFQKFQKKYFFFQRSFFDFFYWRSTNSFQNKKNLNFQHVQVEKKFYPFEQEKIVSLQNKSNNMKNLSLLQRKPKIKKTFENFQQSNFNSVHKGLEANEKNTFFSNFLNDSKKNFAFESKKKIRFHFLKKQRKKDKNSTFFHTYTKTSSFELFRSASPSQQGLANANIPSFGSLKIGNFFPKKKHFQQYWIFPFLGVFVFFSQNSSIVFYQGGTKNQEKFKNSFAHFLGSQKSFQNESRNSLFTTKKTNFGPLLFPYGDEQNGNLQIENKNFLPVDFEISFPSQDSKKLVQVFQNYEKNEFDEFFQFSKKIFQNSISSFPFQQNENLVFQKMFLHNFLCSKNFQQRIETKRNTLKWTWFCVDSEFSPSFRQANGLPQKAEFFFEMPFFVKGGKFRKQNKEILFEKRKMFLTPIFEFSKNLWFLDEYQRKASFRKQSFLQKNDFLFLNSFLPPSVSNSKRNEKTNCIFQKNLGFDSETFFSFFVADKKSFFEKEKTLFFFKNWGKTQKFWNFKTKQNHFKEENFFREAQKNKNDLFQKEIKNRLNLLNLDAIYLQKFLKQLDQTSPGIEISDFDVSKNFLKFENALSGFSPEHENIFLNIQKQTFDFFLFKHYHLKYKKFQNFRLCGKIFQKNNFFVLKPSKKSFSKEGKKSEVFCFLKKKKFFPLLCKNIYFFDFPNFQQFPLQKNQVQNSKMQTLQMKQFAPFLGEQKTFASSKKPFLFRHPILFDYSNSKISQFGKKADNFFVDLLSYSEKNFYLFPQNFSISETKNNLLSSNIFEFSKTQRLNQRKNETNFCFQVSNLTFFEKLAQNLYKNFLNHFVFDFHFDPLGGKKFQELFIFETTQFEKPLLYSFLSKKEMSSFKNESPQFKTFHRVFSLNSKKEFLSSISQKSGNLKNKTQKKSWKKEFSSTFNESPRKYEKVFQTFFSPLKIENTNFSSASASQIQKQNLFSKDQIFLKSFSNLLRKSSKNQNLSFFVRSRSDKKQINQKTPIFDHPFLFVEQSRSNVSFHAPGAKPNRKLESQSLGNTSSKKKQNEQVISMQKNLKLRTKNQISPELLFKRDGFIFFGTKNPSFFSSSQNTQNQTFLRIEKEKLLQKKRRLKKEKLETRRRKKRKRFFPRPTWLRMNLYQKFLKTRHSQKVGVFSFSTRKKFNFPKETFFREINSPVFKGKKKQKIFFFEKSFPNFSTKENDKISSFQKDSSFWFEKQKERKKLTKSLRELGSFSNVFSFHPHLRQDKFKVDGLSPGGQKSSNFQNINIGSFFLKNQKKTFLKKIYGKNFQKWGFYWKNGFSNKFGSKKPLYSSFHKSFSENQTTSISKNIEHYKISGDIFREFLRLSWKSSWFQTNFQPYTKKIQQSFQTIQSLEAKKNFANESFFNFSNFKNFIFHNFYLPKTQQTYKNRNRSFLLEKSVVQKFSWYSNIQNSMNFNPVRKRFGQSFSTEGLVDSSGSSHNPGSTSSEKIQNISEYNRILYIRISEVLRNFKFSENTSNDFFFKQLQVQRRKNEKIFSASNNSFFTKSALFFEKFQVPSQPILPAFSVFSSLFNDSSIKPTGDIPTLRALWAFQKTNLFQFQETNAFRNLWTFKKRTDTLKALKGTKKIMTFFRKYNGFESLPANFKYNKHFGMSPLVSEQNLFRQSSSLFEKMQNSKQEYFSPNFEKTSFLLNKKPEFFDQMSQFDTRTFKKFQNAEKKVSLFGIQSFKQKSKISLRYFKFHLLNLSQKNLSSQKIKAPKYILLQTKTNKDQKKKNFSVSQKKAFQVSPTTNFGIVAEKSFAIKNKNQQNAAKSSLNFWWAQKPSREFDFLGTSFFEPFTVSFFEKSTEEQTKLTFIFISSLFFQFALFSSFFKIPEIRSVFKFQFLIFSKLWKSFFFIFFSLYNLLQKYTKNAFQIFQNSTYSLIEKKSFSFSELQKRNVGADVFFSPKKCIFEIVDSGVQNQIYFQIEKKNAFLSKQVVFEFFPRFSEFFQQIQTFSFPSQDKFLKNSPLVFYGYFSPVYRQRKFEVQSLGRTIKVDHVFASALQERESFQNLNASVFLKTRQKFSFSSKSEFVPPNLNTFSLFQSSKSFKNTLHRGKIYIGENKNLSRTEKNISFFTFSFLVFGKSLLFVPYRVLKIVSNFSTKVFEIVENFFFAVYKFLEKPAEFMIEFIAFVFLIEWSSDIVSFLPDSVESSVWKSSQKLLRPSRIGTFAFNFGIFSSQKVSFFGPFHILFSVGIFTSANFFAFLLQKRLFYVFEHSPAILFQPDIDILVRQRKGMLFWDIWAEILLKAAEKYNVNIPSFVTLKEEQEIFVEKLVRDSQFFQTFQSETFGSVVQKNGSKNSSQSFSNFLQHFVIQNLPSQFFDSSFVSQQTFIQPLGSRNAKNFYHLGEGSQKLQQFGISNLFASQNFQNWKEPGFSSELFINQVDKVNTNKKGYQNLFPFFGNIFSSSVSQLNRNVDNFESFSSLKNINRWESNQYATFQSQETDFFFDIHVPKSLRHVHFLKYYEPAHFTLGSLICGIYAGVFPKQVSKNILVVGESGTAKTLFLQALAGETEMKIITENASRYAIVQRGVAVGMKFLRDVFDAIALQTPCFFVMEDLHIIGSKRPFLISENEVGKGNLSSFGLEQQEVHETNQMIYQSSRHSIADFRRPYKGDFSMGIPTNFFLQTFYSSFLTPQRNGQKNSFGEIEKNSFFYSLSQQGVQNQKGRVFQNSQFFGENFSSKIQNFLSSPFPIDSLDLLSGGMEQNQGMQERQNSNFSMYTSQKNFARSLVKIQSCLQLSKEQIFAPPATSPFTVLMMKEQKKLKPKKRVQETSWGGLSVDQILSYQKESSSVRAKVAILAEKTLNLSRGKFDMITDFLVIIDSVRSNRGFVVFGTTHKPSLLDPALRRPGRFDETLSLCIHPNFLNRFEILKMNFQNGVSTFDFLDSSLLTENFSEIDLLNIISQTKLSFFHNYKYAIQKSSPKFSNFGIRQKNRLVNFSKKERLFSKISPINAFYTNFKSSFFEDFYTQKEFLDLTVVSGKKSIKKISQAQKQFLPLQNQSLEQFQSFVQNKQNFLFRNSKLFKYSILPKGPSHILSLAYSKIGVFLAESNLSQNPTSFIPLSLDVSKNSFQASNLQQFFGNIFYDSRKEQNLQMGVFLSGKISEFLVEKNISISQSSSFRVIPGEKSTIPENSNIDSSKNMFENPSDLFVTKFVFSVGFSETTNMEDNDFSFSSSGQSLSPLPQGLPGSGGSPLPPSSGGSIQKSNIENDLQKFIFTKINSSLFSNSIEQKNFFVPFSSQDMLKKNFSWIAFGNDETWRSATPFLFSLIRKRFLFTKNLFLSKMLFFENANQRRQPPSPPGSSILMPAKKYENFKRTENDFFQKGRFSINEKIQMHQKQRFLKQLYNIPVEKYFHSELRRNHKTLFSSSFQEFAYLDSFVEKTSSIHSYYKKYIQVRHRFSNVHLWWNGMFPEHTRETTYLSDVDWRTMFVSPPVGRDGQKEKLDSGKTIFEDQKKSSNQTFEFLMDFPDSEQYYNPRNRRWFFKFNFNSDIFDSHFSSNEFGSKVLQKKSKNGIDSISVGKTNSTFWALFEKDLQYEIFSHFLMESFYQSFSYFDKKREMLDFFVFHFLSKGFLKEFDFLTTFSRF